MMKKKAQKTIYYMVGMLLASLLLVGCSIFGLGGGGQDTESTGNTDTQQAAEELFLILENNAIDGMLQLYSYETGLEHYYQYDLSTDFLNKYGDHYPSVRFTPGKVVKLGNRDAFGMLTTVQMSDAVWEHEKVKRFSVDEKKGVFTIGDTKYSIRNQVALFSNGEKISFSDLSENDVLAVVGKGNKILSINVTTGHGTLSLSNTDLFEGSLLKLNDDMFAEISKDMSMEIPEGTYTLTVANDGWGSSREIVITRGETTEVDLDSMKGEGKKRGMVSFRINAEEVQVYLDYELIDHTQPVEVTYGTHKLEIRASGYEAWKKYLVVNSKEATLIIELEETEEKDSESEKDSEKESEKRSEKESGTETEQQSETVSETETASESEIPSETETQSEPETASSSETHN